MRRSVRRGFLSRFVWSAGAASVVARMLPGKRVLAQAPGRVSGFDHVAAPMRNTDAMIGFYRALGLRVNEGEGICSVHFGDNKINFHRPALWQNPRVTLRAPAAEPPCGDFCFVWDGGEEALLQALRRADAEIVEGPVERQGGRAGGQAKGVSTYTRDPDGNLLEFIIY